MWSNRVPEHAVKTLHLAPRTNNHRLTSSRTSSLVLMGAGWLKPSSSSSSPNTGAEVEEEDEEEDEDEEELSLREGDEEH